MSEIPDIRPSQRAVFIWYMTGQGLWFVGLGIQFVAFQAIAVLVLGLNGTQLGIAQSALMLPALLFMLPAGVTAERNDGRLLLIRLQLAAAMPPFVLGIMVLTGQLDFTGLIIYAVMMGIISSFVMPTRDSLISHIVNPHEIQRAVTIATGLQFIGQVGGMALVGAIGDSHWLAADGSISGPYSCGGCDSSTALPSYAGGGASDARRHPSHGADHGRPPARFFAPRDRTSA